MRDEVEDAVKFADESPKPVRPDFLSQGLGLPVTSYPFPCVAAVSACQL